MEIEGVGETQVEAIERVETEQHSLGRVWLGEAFLWW